MRRTTRHLVFQQLDERRVLAGYFDQIADEISGPSGVLTQVSRGLDTISSAVKLPIIGKNIEEVDQFNSAFNDFRTELDATLRTLTPGTANEFIASSIVDLLGPAGANLLANRFAPATIGAEDVTVVSGPNSVDIVIDLGISDESFSAGIGLGMDAVPLRPTGTTNGEFKASATYRNFRFGYNSADGAYVDTSAANELELKLNGFLPSSFSAGLGFLNVKVEDLTPGSDPGDEDVSIILKADVTDTGIRDPLLGIELNFQAHIYVQTSEPGLPELSTNFKLQWSLPAIAPNAPLTDSGWRPPTLEFNDVTISVGSFLKDIAQPMAQYVKDVMEPLEPVFNLLEKRIPGISDVAETLGQSSINLVSLSQLLALSPNPPTQFIDAIRSAAKMRDLYQTVSSLANRNSAGAIRLGNFRVAGDGGQSLLNTPAALSNLGLPNWSNLVTTSGGLNLAQIKTQLRNELGDVGGEIADVLTKIASKAGDGAGEKAGFSFSFPVIEDPARVAMGMFLGRDEDLVSVQLDLNLQLKRDIIFQIIPGVAIKVAPSASVNAGTKIGYDTRGLRDAMRPLYIGQSFDAEELLNGLWISGDTHIDVSGSVGIGPVLGFPSFVTFEVLGSVRLDVHAGLHNPSGADKLRLFTNDFGDKLFDVRGTGKADLKATVKIGGEIPVIGDVSWSKSWTFAEATFFKFSTDYLPMPSSIADRQVTEPQLFLIEDIGGLKALRLRAGDWAHGRGIEEGLKDEDFTVEVAGYALRFNQFPRFVPIIDVRAFGRVQRYIGPVDFVLAHMGDGNDKVHVIDYHTKISYSILGGDGDDEIDVDGNVPVFIMGGEGNDTIDGGNGAGPSGNNSFIDGASIVDGQNGLDTITFAEGRLEDLDPAGTYSVFNSSTDSIRDNFLIDNERSRIDTEYFFSTSGVVGDLTIRPNAATASQYAFRYDATVGLKILAGRANDKFIGFPTRTTSLYGGYGDDVFIPVTGLNRLPTPVSGLSFDNLVNFFGGAGDDSLIIDDSHGEARRAYDFYSDSDSSDSMTQLTWSEPPFVPGRLRYSGTESVELMTGSGNDRVAISGLITQGMMINSGLGNDNIVLGFHGNATIRAPLSIDAGPGDDRFELQNVSNGHLGYVIIEDVLPDNTIEYRAVASENITVPVNLEGGEGNNTLQIDDRSRRLSRPTDLPGAYYYLQNNQFHASTRDREDEFATIDYHHMELSELHLSNDPAGYNDVNIASLGHPDAPPTDSLEPVAIYGYESLDTFTLIPRNNLGEATLLRSINLFGGSNSDAVIIEDTNSRQSVDYTLQGYFNGLAFSQTLGGISFGEVALSSNITSVQVFAGEQDDSFELDFTGFIRSLSISSGAGDDLFQVSPHQRDWATSLGQGDTSLAIDGGSGHNSLEIFNQNNLFPFEFGRNGSLFTARSPVQSLNSNNSIVGIQSWEIVGGSKDDSFVVDSVGNGETMIFHGNLGQDSLVLGGTTGTVSGIAGQINFDTGSDGGQARVLNGSDEREVVAHIVGSDDTLLGVVDGDTLFAPGGSVRMRNLRNHPDFTGASAGYGLYLELGTGADSIFAESKANYSIQLSGGEPTSAPGDTLYLSVDQLQSPVIAAGPSGVSTLTSDNRKSVQWVGFENLDTELVIPSYFVVDTTNDSGPGSLRQAILAANATPNSDGPDRIVFALSGRPTYSIALHTALPAISEAVVIDATTQPGYAGKPLIELDGSLVRDNGLYLLAGGNTIRGLAINRFIGTPSSAIFIAGPGGNRIQGNYIGTNLAGDAIYPSDQQQNYGITVFGSDNNLIGTDGNGVNDAWEGNLLSGQNTAGVLLVSGQPGALPDNNIIAGNRIGTSADGRSALGNGRMGVFFIGAGSGNRIGTNVDGLADNEERNLISGNSEAGLYITGNNNLIAGNFIGTAIDGVQPLPNGDGIVIDGSNGNTIGGILPAAANVIAFNRYSGVGVTSGANNSIQGNSIFQNERLGINLSAASDDANYVTPNDDRDRDTGANNLQNYPVLSHALLSGEQTLIGGSLNSTASKSFRIEFFASPTADPSGHGEGQLLLGSMNVMTTSRGDASFAIALAALAPGMLVTATATDNLGNTSEFALSVPVQTVASLPHVATLQSLDGRPVIFTSPVGTTLTVALQTSANVPPPATLSFSSGYFDIALSGLAPGASADILITGLDLPQVRNYYLYGRPASNRSTQWYSFDEQSVGNSSVTGAEIVGGNLVLHLIDGKRGDSDWRNDGTIRLFGGATFNRAPTAVDDMLSTKEDTTLTISGSTLRRNDRDADGDQLRVVLVGAAVGGSVSLVNDVIRFVPKADHFGPASFRYTLSDGSLTTIGRVTINVTEVNDPPIAVNDFATTAEDTRVEIDVLNNDRSGPDNEYRQTLKVTSAQATSGSVSIRPDGRLVYRPKENFFGTDVIRYKIEDNGTTDGRRNPRTAMGTVTVTVTPVNDVPQAQDQSLTVSDDGRVTLALRGSDVETAQRDLVFTILTLPSQGVVQTVNGTVVTVGSQFTGPVNLVYQPGLVFDGNQPELVTYRVSEDSSTTAQSDDGQITIRSELRSATANIDSDGIVRIAGTSGNDSIKVTRSGSRALVYVNQQLLTDRISWHSVREVRVWGQDGDDNIDLSAVDVPTIIVGGNGNDSLRGGQNADLIFGGLGEDQLFDSRGDDILLGNQLRSTVTMDFARQVLTQWRSRRTTSESFKAAVIDDLVKDILRDAEGDDWFLLHSQDERIDDGRSDRDVVN